MNPLDDFSLADVHAALLSLPLKIRFLYHAAELLQVSLRKLRDTLDIMLLPYHLYPDQLRTMSRPEAEKLFGENYTKKNTVNAPRKRAHLESYTLEELHDVIRKNNRNRAAHILGCCPNSIMLRLSKYTDIDGNPLTLERLRKLSKEEAARRFGDYYHGIFEVDPIVLAQYTLSDLATTLKLKEGDSLVNAAHRLGVTSLLLRRRLAASGLTFNAFKSLSPEALAAHPDPGFHLKAISARRSAAYKNPSNRSTALSPFAVLSVWATATATTSTDNTPENASNDTDKAPVNIRF